MDLLRWPPPITPRSPSKKNHNLRLWTTVTVYLESSTLADVP